MLLVCYVNQSHIYLARRKQCKERANVQHTVDTSTNDDIGKDRRCSRAGTQAGGSAKANDLGSVQLLISDRFSVFSW